MLGTQLDRRGRRRHTTEEFGPTAVSGGYTWASINVGNDDDAICGVTTTGVGYCWGHNGAARSATAQPPTEPFRQPWQADNVVEHQLWRR